MNYLTLAAIGFIFILATKVFIPGAIPFDTFQVWEAKGTFWEVFQTSWFAFAWAGAVTTFVCAVTRNDWFKNLNAEAYLERGLLISIIAGVTEEISFRWIFFYSSIALVQGLNWILFGWTGHGLLEWLFVNVLGRGANVLTFHGLSFYLVGGAAWSVGAGILAANGFFQNGHRYLGTFGYVNSWFVGMLFFRIMLLHGIVAAIAVHFLYDMLIFVIQYIDARIERRQGYAIPSRSLFLR